MVTLTKFWFFFHKIGDHHLSCELVEHRWLRKLYVNLHHFYMIQNNCIKSIIFSNKLESCTRRRMNQVYESSIWIRFIYNSMRWLQWRWWNRLIETMWLLSGWTLCTGGFLRNRWLAKLSRLLVSRWQKKIQAELQFSLQSSSLLQQPIFRKSLYSSLQWFS